MGNHLTLEHNSQNNILSNQFLQDKKFQSSFRQNKKVSIIGAGPSGLVSARLLADAGFNVHVYDQRHFIGGNCYDKTDKYGQLIHMYGPHYFRTNSKKLMDWLSQFTQWLPGRYYVKSCVNNQLVTLPIGPLTLSELKHDYFDKEKFLDYIKNNVQDINPINNVEDFCYKTIGLELYELLIKGYTEKQWGLHPSLLQSSIVSRLPFRYDYNERYVDESYQFIPLQGYHCLFQKMSDHPFISIHLNQKMDRQKIEELRDYSSFIIYTGEIDRFFNFEFGPLGYRSLEFEMKSIDHLEFFQPVVQVNYPELSYPYTRIVETKHLYLNSFPTNVQKNVSKKKLKGTTIVYEYPQSHGDPYYPLLIDENISKLRCYQELVEIEKKKQVPIYFLGRLAQYKYFNMDHVMLAAMRLIDDIFES